MHNTWDIIYLNKCLLARKIDKNLKEKQKHVMVLGNFFKSRNLMRFSIQVLQWKSKIKRTVVTALAGFAQWLELQPAVPRDPGSVPGKGMYLGCSLSLALVGSRGGSHSMCPFHINVSLSSPLFPFHTI
uniref:Uncharacterized protein n=1 Tax=Molossus molossus TaxID=27622 RepID=A0A7J8CZG1_MOLMO|nr:hypothetical protein HJG59_009528 [Molossus molossus]